MIIFKTNFIAKPASILLLAFGLLWSLVFLSATPVAAQFNPEINYQGKLTTPLGVSVPDGDYHMRFWLLEDDSIATTSAIWTEVRTGGDVVEVKNGLFSVMLGEVTPLTGIDFNQPLYLGVEIGGDGGSPEWDGEMSPRKILGAVPAAFVSQTALSADTFAGLATSSFLRADQAGLLEATSTGTLLSLKQNGTGSLLELFSGANPILVVDGTNLDLGSNLGIAWNGVRFLYASSTNNSIAYGINAGENFNSDTTYNIALGRNAGRNASSSNSDNNNFIGNSAGLDNTGAFSNIFGYFAGANNTGRNNNLIGYRAGRNNQNDLSNFIGYEAGFNSSYTGNFARNNFIGYQTGYNNDGQNNNLLGYQAGYNNVGESNNFIGYEAGKGNVGDANNFLGYRAGTSSVGSFNNFFGYSAGFGNQGEGNNFFGKSSGSKNEGSYNEMIGFEAGAGLSATSSVIIGGTAFRGGDAVFPAKFIALNNTVIGYGAGYYAETGASNNILLGYRAADNLTTGANNIVIGYDVDLQNSAQSNTLNIGNLLFGTGIDGTGTTLSSGNIGIGTTTPSHKLTVAGDINFTGDLYKNGVLFSSGATDFVGLSDVSLASLTANRIPFTNASGTAVTDSANFGFNENQNRLELGATSTIYFGDNSYLGINADDSNTYSGKWLYGVPTGGSFNNLIGVEVGGSAGVSNNVIGTNAGMNSGGSYNNFLGTNAGRMSLGSNNNLIGNSAGYRTTGDYNEFIGFEAGRNIYSNKTVAIGGQALKGYNETFPYNTLNNNVAVGYGAGKNVQTGANNNILLGYQAADNLTTGANNIVIGYDVDLQSATQSNTLNIGNLLFGTGINGTGTTLSSGNIGIGTSTPRARLAVAGMGVTTSGVVGMDQYFTLANATNGAVQLISQLEAKVQATATSTVVGGVWKLEDSTTFGNVVRGLEIQTDRGTNTLGENTALVGYARTFGIKGVTSGDAGALYEPAGVFAETTGAAQGNALRAYSKSITSAALVKLFQDTSDFTGTGLLMNFGNGGGSFASTSSKFMDLQNAGASVFVVGSDGAVTIGDGTTNQNAGLQIGYGGICVDNDGSCVASTTGLISAVAYHTGNSDLAETYFSSESLLSGEVVYAKGGLSVGRASGETKNLVLGVVSTKPGLLLGADDSSLQSGEAKYPIALTGRVPVRLSTENGDIKAGDELMLSSIPGVVMKASSTGFIVGRALEDFDGTRAYSDTYINQFGDDLVDPVFEPINRDDDPRIDDGCYFGGGRATGEEECVPLAGTSTADRVAEANALALRDAEVRALRDLRYQSGEKQRLNNGDVVRVGQIVMFVNTRYRYVDEAGMAAVQALLARAEGGIVEETIWQRLVNLANNFVDGVLKVFTLQTERVETKELCVDGVCVDADDLRRMLGQEAGAPANGGSGSGGDGGAGAPALPPVAGEEDNSDDEQQNDSGENSEVGTGGENNGGNEEGNSGDGDEEVNDDGDDNGGEEMGDNNDEIENEGSEETEETANPPDSETISEEGV